MRLAERVGGWGAEKLSLLGSLVWSLIGKLPQRLGRLVLDVRHAVT